MKINMIIMIIMKIMINDLMKCLKGIGSLLIFLMPFVCYVLSDDSRNLIDLKNASTSQTSKVSGEIIIRTTCVVCHSKMIIDHAAQSRLDWEKTILKMERQGMPPLPKSLRVSLLDYLALKHGKRGRDDRGNRGPWADARNANPLW